MIWMSRALRGLVWFAAVVSGVAGVAYVAISPLLEQEPAGGSLASASSKAADFGVPIDVVPAEPEEIPPSLATLNPPRLRVAYDVWFVELPEENLPQFREGIDTPLAPTYSDARILNDPHRPGSSPDGPVRRGVLSWVIPAESRNAAFLDLVDHPTAEVHRVVVPPTAAGLAALAVFVAPKVAQARLDLDPNARALQPPATMTLALNAIDLKGQLRLRFEVEDECLALGPLAPPQVQDIGPKRPDTYVVTRGNGTIQEGGSLAICLGRFQSNTPGLPTTARMIVVTPRRLDADDDPEFREALIRAEQSDFDWTKYEASDE